MVSGWLKSIMGNKDNPRGAGGSFPLVTTIHPTRFMLRCIPCPTESRPRSRTRKGRTVQTRVASISLQTATMRRRVTRLTMTRRSTRHQAWSADPNSITIQQASGARPWLPVPGRRSGLGRRLLSRLRRWLSSPRPFPRRLGRLYQGSRWMF